jgi:RNA polymerase sigma-70 factor (ECF subfamily)
MASDDPRERLRRLYGDHGAAILAYALRRTTTPEDAADVVSEVFLVAWRRIDAVPSGEDARLWLYGVARRTLSNQRRGELRRSRLGAALREHAATAAPEPRDVDPALRTALEALRPADRELLALVAWEGLTPAQAGSVLGLAPGTARVRLHRARARLRQTLAEAKPQLIPIRQER